MTDYVYLPDPNDPFVIAEKILEEWIKNRDLDVLRSNLRDAGATPERKDA